MEEAIACLGREGYTGCHCEKESIGCPWEEDPIGCLRLEESIDCVGEGKDCQGEEESLG